MTNKRTYRFGRDSAAGYVARILSASCLLVLAAGNATASDYPALVQAAFDNMERDDTVAWSCTITTREPEKVRVERCDFREGDCAWTLISENGEQPDEKQRTRYAKAKAEKQDAVDEDNNQFQKLAEPGSMQLLEDLTDTAIYSFVPMAESEDERKIMQRLAGQLTVNKSGPYVESFELHNTDTIKPAPFVKLQSMNVSIRFRPFTENGPYYPQEQRSVIKGKVGGLKKISQDQHVEFSDCRLL